MKWTLSQLRKFSDEVIEFDGELKLDDLTDRRDIVSVDSTKVNGEIFVRSDQFHVQMHIDSVITMLDSRTSEDIQVPVSVESMEIFDETVEETDDLDENVHPVIHTLDLEPVIRELIIVNLPNAYTESEALAAGGKDWMVIEEDDYLREDVEKVDPRLEKLKALLDSDEEKED
ncbi:YceD family protein [Salinicoccus halitifaciens]|uniref:DUF177 domain-containing protein n=1 Tax=Salinicoccus halitifaciens TaxID=1073415 RepID=A0ABV2E7U1_9STAP|nr:YceD family protein [Salinicoccus halitifaciens]MCD2136569.1 YceD family protein [Salinicoccus halitifaciens]